MRTALLILVLLVPSVAAAEDYPWLHDVDPVPTQRLEAAFAPPVGFVRVTAEPDSYAAWLRGLPVRTDRKSVLSYAGSPIAAPSAGVVLLDVGPRNLQQCADSVIRLHAEYQWHKGNADALGYHFTSGDLSTWKAWRRGERFKVKGARVSRVRGGSTKSDHKAFRGYLDHVFRYAGTRSLGRDSDEIAGELQAGDFFVEGGGPGHAVILLDVAVHPDGRRAALVGQGYLPAQEFHVLSAPGGHTVDGVWFLLPAKGGVLDTPSWRPFARSTARRFKVR
jgi:hypothetical protein